MSHHTKKRRKPHPSVMSILKKDKFKAALKDAGKRVKSSRLKGIE